MMPRAASKPSKTQSSPHPILPTTVRRPSREPRTPNSPSRALTVKRLKVLYNELKTLDAKYRYPWRYLILVFLAFAALTLAQFLVAGLFSLLPPVNVGIPTVGVYRRYQQMFYNDSDFAYIPDSNIFITTTAKAGSTTIWTWLHPSITGLPNFDACNNTYIQNFHAPCWNGKVVHPFNMSNSDRWRIVNSPRVLRVAFTRDPFERLVSAWKSKAACDSDDFGTDVYDRDLIVPILLRQAKMRRNATCLSLRSFAQVLDTLRQLSEQGKFHLKYINKHFRPQECHFNEIKYDMVLDVSEIANVTLLQPVIKRMKYASMLAGPPIWLHSSQPSSQTMSEETAAALYKFALLTEPFPKRRLAQA